MKARSKRYDSMNDIEQIEINGHDIQFGGVGDGYCYAHQNFDCIDGLSQAEWQAIREVST